MFLQAIEFEMLLTTHLPLVLLARQRVASAFAAQPRVGAAAGDVELLAGAGATAALAACPRPAAPRAGHVFHHRGLLDAMAAQAQEIGATFVVARFRRGAAVTVWPLRIARRHGIVIATDLAFPVGQYSDVIGPALTPEHLRALAATLKTRHRVDVLLVRRIRIDGGLAAAFAEARAWRQETCAAPFVDLSSFADFADYESRFAKRARRNRRQRRQKLEAHHGPISFEVVPAADAEEALREAIGWKRAWLTRQGRSSRVFDGRDNERALLRACRDADAYVSVLRVNGTLAAVELGFAAGPHYAAYLGSYNPAFAAFSVGQEQMLRTIAWCFAQGFARYDLLPPGDGYKRAWTHGTCAVVHDYGLPLSWTGAAYLLVRRNARAAAHGALAALPSGWRSEALRLRTHARKCFESFRPCAW